MTESKAPETPPTLSLTESIDALHDAYAAGTGPRPPLLWCPRCHRQHRGAGFQRPEDAGPRIAWVCPEHGPLEAPAEELWRTNCLIYPRPTAAEEG